ncbi:MAG: GNAT family N-acetyltransferase [Oscillospiraceae bacterium]|jgi:RimJ/RimL family protein N-acetyltransferase|nr:GNAT family N-acetyltransferase [Oscillospiraceae bacterium]
MKYFKKIVGEKVYLSPINAEADAETYTKWVNSKETTRYLPLYSRVYTLAKERETLNRISEGHMYAIVRMSDDALLGNVGFHDIDNLARHAVVGIFIGESSEWGKGYGTEAMKLLVDFGFNTLNLRNIMLTHVADNERAHKSYVKAGFKEFGRRTGCIYRDGKYLDQVYMEILNPRG